MMSLGEPDAKAIATWAPIPDSLGPVITTRDVSERFYRTAGFDLTRFAFNLAHELVEDIGICRVDIKRSHDKTCEVKVFDVVD